MPTSCARRRTPDRPVVHWQYIDPGTHINSVGFNPAGRELDDDTVCNSLVVIESRGSALAPPPAGSKGPVGAN